MNTPTPIADPEPSPVHLSSQDASAGVKNQGVRYVLAISLMLALVVMVIIYLWGGS